MTSDWSEHPQARQELFAEADRLDEQQSGLGSVFLDRIEAAIEDILDRPTWWPRVPYWDEEPRLLHRSAKPFRYDVIYYVRDDDDAVRVIAYAYEGREPGYWRSRLDG